MAANTLSPAYLTAEPVPLDRPSASGWRDTAVIRRPVAEQVAKEDLKWYLMNKYRMLVIDKLTSEDLEELRHYHRRQYDPKSGWNDEYVRKFVMKLREYLHDDILKYEIAGIDALMVLIKPEDLNNGIIPCTVDR